MNKFKPWKLLSVFLAISAVVIIAGIVLMVLLGFNNSADMPENKMFEVKYDVTVINDETLGDKLQTYCEDVFESNGLSVLDMRKATGADGGAETAAFNFYFDPDVSAELQTKVENDLAAKLGADEKLKDKDIYTAWHTETVQSEVDYVWRGAVAVGIVVALVYVGIRFGVGSALTGLALSVHDALFTLAVLAIARIPVYASAPVWYAAVAAFLSLALWLIYCIKLRALKKGSQTPVDAETAMETVYGSAWKWAAVCLGLVAAAVLLLGLVATAGVRAMALPLLAAVVAAAYSSLILGPAIHVYVKRAFDKLSRSNKIKYVGKEKKADK